MNNLYFFQPQRIYTYKGFKQAWLPYSVGCLWAYVSQFYIINKNFKAKGIYFSRVPIRDVVSSLVNPKICLFSNYTWNEQYNLELASQIKSSFPKCKIIFGGPQTGRDNLSHAFIDSVVLGEGEVSFFNLLKDYLKGDLLTIYSPKRINSLEELPSPYTTGVFSDIIESNPDIKWQATLETDRGCPYKCTFCDWGSVVNSKIFQFSLDRVQSELDWVAKNNVVYIYFGNANFGILKKRDLEIAKKIRKTFINSNVETIVPQFAKNSNESVVKIAQILKPFLSKGITMSNQSMSDEVLSNIERLNMKTTEFSFIANLAENLEVPCYTDLILGLPGETLNSFREGLFTLLELGQHNQIDLWFAQILKNSRLAQQIEEHNIETKDIKDRVFYSDDFDGIHEKETIIVSTNSMSTQEMVDSYMYYWLINNFHFTGFSQVLSRAARKKGISFKTFYITLFSKIDSDEFILNCYKKIKNIMTKYLDKHINIDVDFLSFDDTPTLFYCNYEHVIRFSYKTFVEVVGQPDEKILQLQFDSLVKDFDIQNFKFEVRKRKPLNKNFLEFI